jgi:hypothetical protein
MRLEATPAVAVTGVLVITNLVAVVEPLTVSCCVASVWLSDECAVIVGVPATVSV